MMKNNPFSNLIVEVVPETFVKSKPEFPKKKVIRNRLLTNKLRRIISNPKSYDNSTEIIYDTILVFLDYYIATRVLREEKIKLNEVRNVITTRNNLVIQFANEIQIVCVFEIGFTKHFFTIVNEVRKQEWIIADEDGIRYEYDVLECFLD